MQNEVENYRAEQTRIAGTSFRKFHPELQLQPEPLDFSPLIQLFDGPDR